MDKLSALTGIELYPSQIANIEVARGVINASYSNGVMNVKDCLLKSDLFVLEVKGRGASKREMDLTYKAQILDLGLVSRFYPEYPFQGTLTVQGSVHGTLRSPAISLLASGSNLRHGKGTYVKVLSLSGELWGSRDNPRIDLKGSLEDIRVSGKRLDGAEFAARSEGRAVLGSLSLTAEPKVRFETSFKLEDIVSEEKIVEISDLRLAFKDALIASRTPAYVRFTKDAYVLDGLNLYYSEASFIAGLNLHRDGRIASTINLSGIDLEKLSEAFGIAPAIHGVTVATVRLSHTLEHPEITAELNARALSFEEFRSDAARLSLGYRGGVFDLALSVVDGSREILSSSGTMNYDLNLRQVGKGIKEATFDIAMTSEGLELSPLANASEEIKKINGLLLLNLRARGSIGNPRVEGTAQVKDVSLRLASMKNKLFAKDVRVELGGTKGEFKAFDLETEGGRGRFEGEFDLTDLSYNINGTLSDFLVEPKYITARLKGRVGIEGSGKRLRINGKVTATKATVRIPEEPIKDVEDITFVDEHEEEFLVEEARPSGYFRNNVALEVRAKLQQNTWVKGRGANVEIQGDLAIEKSFGDELRLSGGIETVRGTYQIFGKVFRIERGTISFGGTKEINPSLDVHALYRAGGVKIFINVTGTAQKQVLNLTSDPPMDDADIISYILFGTSTDKIGAGARASIQQTAGKIAGGIAAKELNKLLGERLALDVLSIGGAGGETEVEVGKYITDRLYVSYERRPLEPYSTTQPEFTNRLRVEYIITNYLTAESATGGEDAGLDLFFYFRY
ncbi:MAG: translocation/assembly module TamB domain-containing protein [Candidatus Methanosuratincola sp.]